MEITFFTPERMNQLWGFVEMLLKTVQPMIMIVFAIVAVGLLLGIVINAWKRSSKDLEHEDDDYEYREY